MRLQYLGYAVTAHRAQGVTTDTSHILATEATTRENLYVGLTRGRQHNHAWVVTDQPDDLRHTSNRQATAHDVLEAVLRNQGTEPSAHQAAADEHNRWNRIDHLVAMRQEVHQAAMADRWAILIEHSGLTPQATGPIRDDMKTSLTEIEAHLLQRATESVECAVRDHETWLAALWTRPTDAHAARHWDRAVQAVAAYHERWDITEDRPLRVSPTGVGQQLDLARVRQALAAARNAAEVAGVSGPSAVAPVTGITM